MEAQDYVSNLVQMEKMSRAKVTRTEVLYYYFGSATERFPHGFVTFSPSEAVYTGSRMSFGSVLVALVETRRK